MAVKLDVTVPEEPTPLAIVVKLELMVPVGDVVLRSEVIVVTVSVGNAVVGSKVIVVTVPGENAVLGSKVTVLTVPEGRLLGIKVTVETASPVVVVGSATFEVVVVTMPLLPDPTKAVVMAPPLVVVGTTDVSIARVGGSHVIVAVVGVPPIVVVIVIITSRDKPPAGREEPKKDISLRVI